MTFLAEDDGATLGGGAAPAESQTQPEAEKAAVVDYKALLLAILSLPAEATDEEITAKEAEIRGTLAGVGELQTQAGSVSGLQAELDATKAKLQEFEAEAQKRREGETDALLEEYEGLSNEAKTVLRDLILSDKAKGETLLASYPKKKPAAPVDQPSTGNPQPSPAPPPAPKHNPGQEAEKTADEKISEGNALIEAVQKEGKFKDYSSAREEARRRKPELFS